MHHVSLPPELHPIILGYSVPSTWSLHQAQSDHVLNLRLVCRMYHFRPDADEPWLISAPPRGSGAFDRVVRHVAYAEVPSDRAVQALFSGENQERRRRLLAERTREQLRSPCYDDKFTVTAALSVETLICLLKRNGREADSSVEDWTWKVCDVLVSFLQPEWIGGSAFRYYGCEPLQARRNVAWNSLRMSNPSGSTSLGRCGFALQAAVQWNDMSLAAGIIEDDPKTLNSSDAPIPTALWVAIRALNAPMARWLMDRGASPHASTVLVLSPLTVAAFQGGDEMVEVLLHGGVYLDPSGVEFGSALGAAAGEGHVSTVKLLLAKTSGERFSRFARFINQSLTAAAGAGHLEIVQILLRTTREGVRANGRSAALMSAAGHGHADVLQLGLEGGYARPDKSALIVAATNGHVEACRVLLDHGVDLNTPHRRYRHPLVCAAHNGHRDVVRLLVERGADLRVESVGAASLFAAVYPGHLDTVRLLLERGVDVNATAAPYEDSPVGAAIYREHQEIVKLLLEYGARIPSHCSSYYEEQGREIIRVQNALADGSMPAS